jgi:hypothetical protein
MLINSVIIGSKKTNHDFSSESACARAPRRLVVKKIKLASLLVGRNRTQ